MWRFDHKDGLLLDNRMCDTIMIMIMTRMSLSSFYELKQILEFHDTDIKFSVDCIIACSMYSWFIFSNLHRRKIEIPFKNVYNLNLKAGTTYRTLSWVIFSKWYLNTVLRSQRCVSLIMSFHEYWLKRDFDIYFIGMCSMF